MHVPNQNISSSDNMKDLSQIMTKGYIEHGYQLTIKGCFICLSIDAYYRT